MQSDTGRALGALVISCAGAVALVAASPALHRAGWISAPHKPVAESGSQDLLYAIIDLTEEYEIMAACPLDLEAAKTRVESALRARNLNPVYTPIAEGPGVLIHEVEALEASDASVTPCVWRSTTLYAGHRLAMAQSEDFSQLETASQMAVDLGIASVQ